MDKNDVLRHKYRKYTSNEYVLTGSMFTLSVEIYMNQQ